MDNRYHGRRIHSYFVLLLCPCDFTNRVSNRVLFVTCKLDIDSYNSDSNDNNYNGTNNDYEVDEDMCSLSFPYLIYNCYVDRTDSFRLI